jgi:hypothetical protein
MPNGCRATLTIDADAVRAEVEHDNENIRQQRTSDRI